MTHRRTLLLLVLPQLAAAWISTSIGSRRLLQKTHLQAGFGASKAEKEVKLKPKQQWDRYLKMKSLERVAVAVRKSDDEEWLEVGHVKMEGGDANLAVARQRALIAEVSKGKFVNKAVAV